jgi:hypothetical protein
MTCCRKATACSATMCKGYSTAGQYSPFAYQRELTLRLSAGTDPIVTTRLPLRMLLGANPVLGRRHMTICWGGYARGSKRKISESMAFKALMCTLFNMSLDPSVGTPLSVRAPLEPIKGRTRMLEHRLSHTKLSEALSDALSSSRTHTRKLTLTQSQLFLTKISNTSHGVVGFYAPEA